ncbi:MAG: TonB-dependent receptor [Bryobacteraceae bacterium]|nr:TonB-dependent receptor [Bryobacteraceae bacterium]
MKGGFDWRSLNHDGAPGTGPSSFSFNDIFTRSTPNRTVPGTGASLAGLLLGYPSGGSMVLASNFYNYVKYYAGFVQDDFRVTSKVTLNFGLRYEYETGPAERSNNFITGFDTERVSPLQSGVPDLKLRGVPLYAGLNGNGTHSGNPNGNKISPRIGVAWSITPGTAIRGGYGLFWVPTPFSFQSTLGYSQSTPIVASFDNNATPAASLDNPFPGGLLRPAGNSAGEGAGIGQDLTFYDRNARSGYVQQYSFDIQRQLPSGFVLAAGYIGSKSSHLPQDGRNINQLSPDSYSLGSQLNQSVPNPLLGKGGVLALGGPTITRSQLLRPFPQFSSVSLSNSDTNRALYHALYMKVQRRFTDGMTAVATYTWSQNKDLAYGTTGNSLNTAPASPQNAYDLDAEYGLSTTHTPHKLALASTYELPFGKGRRMLSTNRWLDVAVGGWSANVIATFQSGFPLAISQINNNGVIGSSVQRPNATGASPVTSGPLTDRLDNYINPAAFSQAPQYTFGNVSRTIGMRGPGIINWDASLFKTFSVTEKLKAQFRAEALNLTNTPSFYGPNTTFGNPSFGKITSQANFSRLIQLGVRFYL